MTDEPTRPDPMPRANQAVEAIVAFRKDRPPPAIVDGAAHLEIHLGTSTERDPNAPPPPQSWDILTGGL